MCLLSSFCFGGNKINILDTNVRHILRRCTLPARPLAFPQRPSPLSVKEAPSPHPLRPRPPGPGHPHPAATLPAQPALSRPRPLTSRPPVGRAFTPAATPRRPAISRFGRLPFRGCRTPCRCSLPVSAAYLPPACRAGVHTRRDPAPLCSPGSPAAPGLAPHPNTPTHRRRARHHDIRPSQPTIGDHPGKRS